MRNRTVLTFIMACVVAISAIATSSMGVQAQAKKPIGPLEIFSWWTGPGEGEAFDALLKRYNELYPDVKINNAAVSGGAGVAARAVLKTRMLGGNPPDTFMVHAGAELIKGWVAADRMEPLTEVFKSEGWMDKFPKGLLDMITYKGDIWTVPVNVHRANVMWYVPENLKKWNITVPESWDDFFKVCASLKGKNITPLEVGQDWTTVELFDDVLLAQIGPDDYNALYQGKINWTDDKVKAAWDTYGKVMDCTNADNQSLSWQQATDAVIDGSAAFNLMGDWSAGYMSGAKKLTPGKDFGWSPAPGTKGTFMMVSDSFGLPKNVKDKDATLAFLKLIGTVEAQDLFNPIKGSIAARLDSDLSKYNEYGKSAAADWKSNKVVGSMIHGAVGGDAFSNDFATVVSVYITTRDPNIASAAAQQIAINAGIAK
jgi:glucose/mannose transport system substrate-binding protein